MQEEMRLHLERATERLLARGLSPEEARKAARREFGNIEFLQERMFFFRGLRLSALGLFAGLPLGIIAIRLATGGISAIQVSAPALALSIACVVMSVAALASWIPARHAAGIDPLESLRAE